MSENKVQESWSSKELRRLKASVKSIEESVNMGHTQCLGMLYDARRAVREHIEFYPYLGGFNQ